MYSCSMFNKQTRACGRSIHKQFSPCSFLRADISLVQVLLMCLEIFLSATGAPIKK